MVKYDQKDNIIDYAASGKINTKRGATLIPI